MKLLKNCMQWVKMSGLLIKGFLLLIAVLGWPTGCVSWPEVFLCGWGQVHLWCWLLPDVQHRTGTNIPFFAPSPILHSLFTLSVIKTWLGKFPCALYVSMETIAHATVFHVIVVSLHVALMLRTAYVCNLNPFAQRFQQLYTITRCPRQLYVCCGCSAGKRL